MSGEFPHRASQDVTALPACRATDFPRHLAWTRLDTGHACREKWKHEAQVTHSLDASRPQLKQPGARVSCSLLEGNGIRLSCLQSPAKQLNTVDTVEVAAAQRLYSIRIRLVTFSQLLFRANFSEVLVKVGCRLFACGGSCLLWLYLDSWPHP